MSIGAFPHMGASTISSLISFYLWLGSASPHTVLLDMPFLPTSPIGGRFLLVRQCLTLALVGVGLGLG